MPLLPPTKRRGAADNGVSGSGDALITNVRYNGSVEQNNIEVDERAYMN